MDRDLKPIIAQVMQSIEEQGLYKEERVIDSPQGAKIITKGKSVLNFCANNYLGLSSHPKVVAAAEAALKKYGYGLSSVRFICGTQSIHKELEHAMSDFLGTEDTILYGSCFDANTGLFETLLTAEDAIISDALNHASVIDGIRLCKAERHVYQHNNMEDLRSHLEQTKGKRLRMIAVDGVFSMDGELAPLKEICSLAEEYNALVMVDDSHATGFIGPNGRGTPEHFGVQDKIDVVTTTFGKALGGASGGCTSGRREIIGLLRQRSRPYLFSNTLAPMIAAASLEVLKLLSQTSDLRKQLMDNAAHFRKRMTELGFTLRLGFHPTVPVMLGDAKIAKGMASDLLNEGIYVIGFSY
ncbi:MAG TPA: glycine C-acetyltransferase, partial [Candidatus Nanoarchaeia archaeon]|nr:glycine C-acetyltransferase [Candidatus Nanoarchaeia archaeon]